MNSDLTRAAFWRFRQRHTGFNRALLSLLVVALFVGIAVGGYFLGYRQGQRIAETGGPAAYYPPGYSERHFDLPTVFAPCYATAAQIDAYFAKVAPLYKGTGAAIVEVSKTYGYDPSFVVALMRHEGGNGTGGWCKAPYYNCFSWGVSDHNPVSVEYHSFSKCVLQVMPAFYRNYQAKGAPYNHGTALLGIAVKYVGGAGNQITNDIAWQSSIWSMQLSFIEAVYTPVAQMKWKYVTRGELHPTSTVKDYWGAPMSRLDMMYLLENINAWNATTK